MQTKELSGTLVAHGLKFGIVISRFNDLFTAQLLRGALDCLERHGVKLIGANLEAIEKGEDRQLFKQAMNRIGVDMPKW